MTSVEQPAEEKEAVLEVVQEGAPEAGVSGGRSSANLRKQASRRKLLDAARKLFVERGYHDTRPQDISRAAGVGHGTFYLHFTDKLDCFLAFAEEAGQELEAVIDRHGVAAHNLEEGIREMLAAIFEYSRTYPGVLTAALADPNVLSTTEPIRGGVMPIDRWARNWAARVEHWQRTGEARPDIDPKIAGYLLLGGVKQLGTYVYRNKLDPSPFVDQITKLLVHALKD